MRSAEELSEIAFAVAREAAELVVVGFRSRPAWTEKGRADLVTEYDLASEKLIRRRLAEAAPELDVVAEEHGGEVRSAQVFFCDPLDGTTNFVHGHPFWCVSIGVLEAGAPVAGAVVAPSLATSWRGWRGGPALRNDAPCAVSGTAVLRDALLATGFPSERSTEPANNFTSFVRAKKAARGVRRCGSAAIDLCMVADGTYDGYWERQLNAWDLAAGAALVMSAGGRLTSLSGGEPNLAVGPVAASNGRIHDALLALI
jgi:myo-inositol-1(or 4)-monophosphatase